MKEFITQKASVMDIIEGKLQGGLNKGENGQTKSKDEKEEAMNKLARARQTTAQMTRAVQWRRPGLMYKKNEVYLDVIETISCVTQANGDALRASCSGRVVLNAKLSGMPELKIGLNDTLGARRKVEGIIQTPAMLRVTSIYRCPPWRTNEKRSIWTIYSFTLREPLEIRQR